jgi:hypothetical protein
MAPCGTLLSVTVTFGRGVCTAHNVWCNCYHTYVRQRSHHRITHQSLHAIAEEKKKMNSVLLSRNVK